MAGANPAAPAYGEEIIPGAPNGERKAEINLLSINGYRSK